MKYKLLGKSGLRVSELCLGTMGFGEEWGFGANREECKKIFETFTETGGNFIDTANKYTNGTSEKFVGEFVASQRDYFVLATKYSLSMREDDPNAFGNHRKNLVQSVNASLKRLNTDYIDLLWVHAWDFMSPVEEVMRALDDLVRQGKVLYIGVSDTPAWIISQANTLAGLKGWSSFIGMQLEYSLIQRDIEREYVPMGKAMDIGITAWAPLGGSVLTGKYTLEKLENNEVDSKRKDGNQTRITGKNLKIAEEVQKISDETGYSCAQIAINWVRQKGTIPIFGSRKNEQVKDCLNCLNFELTPEQMSRLDEISRIELGFPHDFMGRMKNFVFGQKYNQIVNHRSINL